MRYEERAAYERSQAASREAKRRRTGRCRECGAITRYNGRHGKLVSDLCAACNGRARAAASLAWTRERLVAALHDAHRTLGRQPGIVDFNPNQARNRSHDEERAALSERMIAAGRWPWHSAFYQRFGSFAAACEAAGFTPHPPHGTRETAATAARRKPRPTGREAPSPRKEQRS